MATMHLSQPEIGRYQLRIEESKKCSNFKPEIGETGYIKEELPQGKWKLGKLEQLIQSNDEEIRVAKVKMSNESLLKQPLNLLYPIELAGTNETDHSNQKKKKKK